MLSYQHMYHAGSLVDVHKHLALSILLKSLPRGDKPFSYMETHAGRGLYDLTSEASEKTGEAKNGIERILQEKRIPQDHPFMKALTAVQEHYGNHAYPGSPMVAQALLPDSAKLFLMELHPQEYTHLRHNIVGRNVKSFKRDGYDTVLELCPPRTRHGMVLIDPSYEIKSEYMDAVEFIRVLRNQWQEGAILLWYPVLEAGFHQQMVTALKKQHPNLWQQEITFPPLAEGRMRGSGLIAINLPLGIEEKLDKNTAFLL